MRYAEVGSAIRPRAARLPPIWFPRSGRPADVQTRRLTCLVANNPGQGKLRAANPSECGRQAAKLGGTGSGGAPVGGVLAMLGKHVREHSETEPVKQERENGRHSVGDPAVIGVDEPGERAEQNIVRVVNGLAELAIHALASGLLDRSRRDRGGIPPVALVLPVQLDLLRLRATVERVVREMREPEEDESG